MATVKIRRDEMEIVKEAASRIARRSNSRFVIDPSRVEIADKDIEPGSQLGTENKPVLTCD